jgi:uncharacterized membrane protein SirB2
LPDTQELGMLIKIIHMTAGMLVVVLFYTQLMMLLIRRRNGQAVHIPEVPRMSGLQRFLKISMHMCWTIVIVAGIYLLVQLSGIYPYWLLTKIGLFVLAIIFSIFSFRAKGSMRLQNIGLIGAAICYALIVGLVVIKPWGFLLTGSVNQPVTSHASINAGHVN